MEARVQEIGRELFRLAQQEHEHLTTLNRWTKQVLGWCLADPRLKGQVLRFIDALPALRSPQAVVRHLHEYFPAHETRLPAALRAGVSLARPGLLTASAAAAVVRQLVEQVARQFIAGSRLDEATPIVQRMRARGFLVSFDLLGEQVTSEREADQYTQAYLTLLATPGLHLSVKPSSLTPHFDPLSFDDSVSRALARLLPIARRAAEAGAAMTLDMEQYEYRDMTLALAKHLLEEPGLGERIRLGVVIQAYLADAEPVTEELIQWLAQHHRRLSVRLVKGAYWDYEVAHARQRGWPIPVHREKWQTDQAFERLTRTLVAASSVVRTEFGSHNL
ncbi:MAG: proline dehydrogenase family protein, partial [Candidatus Omnitrophica bacterium]|nr:proline dehydrogenase family protein [Candidatus Omnitrophota bacterium]